MSYLVKDSLQPRLFILACNVDAVVIQSTQEEAKLLFVNKLASAQQSIYPNFSISSCNEKFKFYKDSNVISTFQYDNNQSIQTTDIQYLKQVEFQEGTGTFTLGPGIGYCNNTLLVQLSNENNLFQVQTNVNQESKLLLSSTYNTGLEEARLGIGISNPTEALHVIGNVLATGTLTASNLVVLGDTVILDTITSNTEQLIITNLGSGPALKVSQEGVNNIAEFYDDGSIVLMVADGGNVGIGTAIPKEQLDVEGSALISGNLGVGNINLTGDIYQNGVALNISSLTTGWVFDNATSNLYFTTANIGIGTNLPIKPLHVLGETLLEGTVTTNNNNIDVGTGTITAATFSGTATQVSSSLSSSGYLLGDSFNGSTAQTWTVNASSNSSYNNLVARDSNSNIYVGGIGIGTTETRSTLDIIGTTLISGNIGIGTTTETARLTLYNDTVTQNSLYIHSLLGSKSTFYINPHGNVGINTTRNPLFTPLSISPDDYGAKITLLDITTSEHHFGFGVSSGKLNYHVMYNTDNHVFYAGGKNGDGTELMRITGTGNVGIGTTAPRQPLEVQGNIYFNGNLGIGTLTPYAPLVVNGLLSTNNNNIDAGTGTITAATFSGTATQVSQTLTISSYLTGDNYNGSVATTWAVDADTAATANKVVARDASGNMYAGNVGLGTTVARTRLDIIGNSLISGNLGIGTDLSRAKLYIFATGATQDYFRIDNDTTLTGVSGPFIIDKYGNVGIGLTSPMAALHVDGGVSGAGKIAAIIQVNKTTDKALQIKGLSSTQTANLLEVYRDKTSSTPDLIIDGTGANLGIGTTAARQKLDIQGGNAIIAGNIGISTATPRQSLDIIGKAIISSQVGIATTTPRQSFDVIGDAIVSANIGIATLSPRHPLDVIGNAIVSANIGIATNSPQANLHIASAIPTIKLDGGTNGNLINMNDNSYVSFGSDQSYKTHILVVGDTFTNAPGRINLRYKNYVAFDAVNGISGSGTEKMRIDANGNVGIGTTAPLRPLHVEGIAYINGNIGINTTTPSDTLTVNGNIATNNQVISTVATGTAPLSVQSTTLVNNLNVEFLDGHNGSFYRNVNNITTGTLIVPYGGTGCNLLPSYKVLVGNGADPITTPWELHWQAGNLGIGTNQPKANLDVIGTMRYSQVLRSTISTGTPPLDIQSSSLVSNLNVQYLNGQDGNYYTDVNNINNGILSVVYGGTGSNYLSTNKLLVGQGTNSVQSPIELHWDGSQLGIGTTQPRQRLDLDVGNLTVGNIGIGTAIPTQALEVYGMTLTQSIGINTSYARKTVDIIGDVIQQGNLGIGTTTSPYAVQVYSSESVFTIHQGKVGISKGVGISPTTDLEIRNSSVTDYTGILLNNNGNVYPNASLRIQGTRFDNASNLSYTANMGLQRYNPNAALNANVPLGLIHFGGNHTSGNTANRAYTAYIGAISEETFASPSTMRTAIIFKTGSNAYQYYDTAVIHENESMRINADGNLGIGTTQPTLKLYVEGDAGISRRMVIGSNVTPNAALEIYSTDAMLVPKGTTAERPTEAELGYIRYNTDYKQFEGFAEDNQWQALEGVKSIEGDTYIIAEYSPGNDDKGLHFYTSNVEQLILNVHGNLGLGTTLPQQRLDVNGISYFRANVGIGTVTPLRPLHVENGAVFLNGNVGIGTTVARAALEAQPDIKTTTLFTDNFYTSNFTVTGSYFIQNDEQYIRNSLQITPVRITQQVQNSSTCNFVGSYIGLYKAIPEATEVYVNGYKMAYSTTSNKDYDITYELDNVNLRSIFSITLEETPAYGDIVDIIIWPQYLDPDGMLQPGYVLQNINFSYWNKSPYNSNLYYTTGNIGIGTETPIYPLDVPTNAYIQTLFSSNVYTEQYISTGAKIGINTTLPYTSLDIRTTDAILLPKGTTAQRPSGIQGLIRYNTDTSQFEGLGAADQWGSLGGVKSTDQQTYITAELSAGTNDGNLRFYNQNNLNMIITPNGNVGIGIAVPTEKLHVDGNIYSTGTIITSNLRVIGDFVTMNTITSNTEQIVIENDGTGPALKVTQSGNMPIAEFYDKEVGLSLIIDNNGNVGIGSSQPSRILDIGGDVYLNGVLTTNNTNINAGTGTITAAIFAGTATQVSQTLTIGAYLLGNSYNGSTATTWDINASTQAIIDKIVARDSLGSIYVSNIGIGTSVARQALDIYGNGYIFGNVAIGTSNIQYGKLVVAGNIVPSACNVYDLGTSNLRFRDIYLSGKSIDLGGTRITRDDITKGINITDENGNYVDTTISTIFASNIYIYSAGNIGIGTTYARQKLDVQGGNAIVSGNIGIGTTTTNVSLEVHSTNAVLLPKGTNTNRPTGIQGYIRYNSESQQFEGFGAGNQWGSLGGVKSVAGDTYILAEYSAGNDDKSLHFYTSNLERMTLDSNGYLGIGTTTPRTYLDVNGNIRTDYLITTSNLMVLGNLNFSPNTSTLRTNLQINPIRKTIYINTETSNEFYLQIPGTFGGYASNTQVFLNQNLLMYYTDTIKDYDVEVTYTASPAYTNYTITLTTPAIFGDIIDITIWPQIIQESATEPGYVYQQVQVTDTYFRPMNNDIYYNFGNVGIGTSNTNLGKLVVEGNIVPSACNVYDLGTSNLRWRDIYLSGNTINLGGTAISRNDISGGVSIKTETGALVDNTVHTLHASNVIIYGGNIGIGTTIPTASLHVNGDIQSPALVGQVAYFAMSTAPTGWLKCNGNAVSRASYASLFQKISTTYGSGDGSTTFTLPDLRGEFLRGWDDGRNIDTSRSFASAQTAAMLDHTHTGTTTSGEGTHTHTITDPGHTHQCGTGTWDTTANTNGVDRFPDFSDNGPSPNASTKSKTTGISINTANSAHTHTMTTGNPSTGGGTETRPRNIALLACIKF
jgi:microcystin-dependent protein